MSQSTRVVVRTLALVFATLVFLFLVPSLIGGLMVVLLVVAVTDYSSRRYRNAVRQFNSAVRAVCHHDGAISKVAMAFSRSGPLSGPCYEYARRLMMGEQAIEAAVRAQVPLMLQTAVAMQTPPQEATDAEATADRERQDDQQLVRRELAMVDTTMMPAYGQFIYLTATALVTCNVLAFVTIFIVPTFEVMFDEFGLELPFPQLFSTVPSLGILLLLVVVGAVIIPLLNRGHLLGIRMPRWVPTLPRLAERKAEILCGVADAVDAGWPMGRALALGHEISTRHVERRSLERAMRCIEQGADPVESLHRSGWIDASEAGWLAGASAPRTSQLLRTIADQNVRDARSNLRWMMAVFFPVLVVVLGLVVLAYAFGFFATMLQLIYGLS